MTTRRTTGMLALLASLAASCGSAAAGDAPSGTEVSEPGPTTTAGPVSPPPAQVLDATLVYFDPDGVDRQPALAPPGAITDRLALDAFAQRYVDGDPTLGAAARAALADGKVLVGGTVSTGCFTAHGAQLTFTAVDVRLLPVGLPPDDPDIECVRAVRSVALVAVDAAELPAGLPIRGTR